MHRITSRILLLVLVAALLTGPTGCTALGITPTPEPVTLRFAVAEGVMPIQRLVDEFHAQYPWITVQFYETSAFGGNSVQQWVRTGGVDVFRTSREAMAWIDDGLLKPIDDMHLDDFQEIRSDYYGGLWDALSKRASSSACQPVWTCMWPMSTPSRPHHCGWRCQRMTGSCSISSSSPAR